jgi:NADP-dependent 3-hydroxy acid dehydrogenase YdfG
MTEAHIEPFSNEELMAALADEIDKAVPDVIDVTDDAALEFARKRAVGDIDPDRSVVDGR